MPKLAKYDFTIEWLDTDKLNQGEEIARNKRKIPKSNMLWFSSSFDFKILKKLVINFEVD